MDAWCAASSLILVGHNNGNTQLSMSDVKSRSRPSLQVQKDWNANAPSSEQTEKVMNYRKKIDKKPNQTGKNWHLKTFNQLNWWSFQSSNQTNEHKDEGERQNIQ